jgi:hypothetical protein
MKEETIDRRVAAGISVVTDKRGVDRRALDAGCTPLGVNGGEKVPLNGGGPL